MRDVTIYDMMMLGFWWFCLFLVVGYNAVTDNEQITKNEPNACKSVKYSRPNIHANLESECSVYNELVALHF